MLSPAQPSPAPAPSPSAQLSGKKMYHFSLLFSWKILEEHEIMLFQNRKNKIFFHTKYIQRNVPKVLVLVSCFFDKSSCFSSNALPGVQISKAALRPWIHQFFNENQWFLMIFRRKLSVKKSTRRFCNGSESTRKTRENNMIFVENWR